MVIFSGCSDTSPPFQLYQLLMCGSEDAVKNPSRGQWSDSIRQSLAVWLAGKGQEAGNQSAWQKYGSEKDRIGKKHKKTKNRPQKSAVIKQPRVAGQQEIT